MRKLILAAVLLAPIAAHAQTAYPDVRAACQANATCWGNVVASNIRHAAEASTNNIVSVFGGTLILNKKDGSFAWQRGAADWRFNIQAAQIDRSSVRCVAQAQLFYVNDALNTQQELYDGCMQRELSARGR